MNLQTVVVKVGEIVVIINGDATPIIGKASNPEIAAAAAKIFGENPSIQVEQGDAEVLLVHTSVPQMWKSCGCTEISYEWVPSGNHAWGCPCASHVEFRLSVEKPEPVKVQR